MSDVDSALDIFDGAERNERGELTTLSQQFHPTHGVVKTEKNLTRLFGTAPRKSENASLLVAEARLADEGKDLGNPARPTNASVAKEAIERMEDEGLEPAWQVCDREEWP